MKILCRVLREYKSTSIDILILITIFVFLLSYFTPDLFLSLNIPTGGDMPSHYYPAKYLKDVLLPKGRIVGWMQGNYAGFPLFQVYFPFPFLLMVLLSYAIPMQIAFKIISVLGVFSLPLCSYFSIKLMHYKFPCSIIGALFTLPFLFMEANSMWGGNIPSTLAGEFAFSIGMSLSVLLLGTLYHGMEKRGGVLLNGALLFFVGFSHAYTLLFSVFTSAFFVITRKDFVYKLKYLFKVYTLAFLLLSFWAIPLIANIAYTTNFNIIWKMDSFFEVIPVILIPFVVVSVMGSIAHIYFYRTKKEPPDPRLGYFWFGIAISILFYFSANKIGVVDIRFLPCMQLLFTVIAAVIIYKSSKYTKLQWMVPLLLTPLVLLWVSKQVTYIPGGLFGILPDLNRRNCGPSSTKSTNIYKERKTTRELCTSIPHCMIQQAPLGHLNPFPFLQAVLPLKACTCNLPLALLLFFIYSQRSPRWPRRLSLIIRTQNST
ncbi:MAG: hypothetical protein HS132_00365 [Planctomycetia bacterium]|nr:hypothetical protein [Planctomycetia bacterium]